MKADPTSLGRKADRTDDREPTAGRIWGFL